HGGEGPAVGQERGHQAPFLLPGPGVDHHPRGLVHHDQVGVLVDDVQGNGLGADPVGLGRRDDRLHLVAPVQEGLLGRHLPVDPHVPRLDPLLPEGPGALGLAAGQELVEAEARLLRAHLPHPPLAPRREPHRAGLGPQPLRSLLVVPPGHPAATPRRTPTTRARSARFKASRSPSTSQSTTPPRRSRSSPLAKAPPATKPTASPCRGLVGEDPSTRSTPAPTRLAAPRRGPQPVSSPPAAPGLRLTTTASPGSRRAGGTHPASNAPFRA